MNPAFGWTQCIGMATRARSKTWPCRVWCTSPIRRPNRARLRTYRKPDEAGRGIERLALERADGGDIRELVRYLAGGSPSIRTRNHHLDDGVALVDPREIDAAQAQVITDRVRAFFESTSTESK